MDDVDIEDLHNSSVSTAVFQKDLNWYEFIDWYNDASYNTNAFAEIGEYQNKQKLTAFININDSRYKEYLSTVSNVQNLLGVHDI